MLHNTKFSIEPLNFPILVSFASLASFAVKLFKAQMTHSIRGRTNFKSFVTFLPFVVKTRADDV